MSNVESIQALGRYRGPTNTYTQNELYSLFLSKTSIVLADRTLQCGNVFEHYVSHYLNIVILNTFKYLIEVLVASW